MSIFWNLLLTKTVKLKRIVNNWVERFNVQPRRRPKKRPVKSKKKHNSSPQRTQRKKILNNLCDLRDLCGEIFLENGIGYDEVSYKGSRLKRPYRYILKGFRSHMGGTAITPIG